MSLVDALEGDGEGALRHATDALDEAHYLASTLLEAQANIRAGHAMQLVRPDDYRVATERYLQALMLADAGGVPTARAEAYVGLTLLHGFQGQLAAAEDATREGLRLVEESGDEWSAAYLWTALGAVAVANSAPEGERWLQEALSRHLAGKDTYGQAVCRLWLSVKHYRAGNREMAGMSEAGVAVETFELAQRHGYQSLFTRPTLFGPRDRMVLVPLLLAARKEKGRREAAQAILKRAFPAIALDNSTGTYHPGMTLRIQTLGPLRVWRGREEIGPHEWQRKKAQEMLALLITNRERWLLREQICDRLWPDESQEDAVAQFKVTLNGLNTALEPLRPPRTPPFFIRRQGGAYRFSPPDGVWLDVAEFEAKLKRVRSKESATQNENTALSYDELASAVELYQGEYLSDWLYEDWARDERERIDNLYKEAATLLARATLERGELYDAVRLCEAVLARDPGWEDAYVVLMRAYARQGNRRLVLATYDRCVRNLREHLDVEPLPSTTMIYEQAKA